MPHVLRCEEDAVRPRARSLFFAEPEHLVAGVPHAKSSRAPGHHESCRARAVRPSRLEGPSDIVILNCSLSVGS